MSVFVFAIIFPLLLLFRIPLRKSDREALRRQLGTLEEELRGAAVQASE